MAKMNARLDTVRKVYREALDEARAKPTAEAWAKLLAAGKDLSALQEPKPRSGRRSRRDATPTIHDLEDAHEAPRENETLE
jgi:hypothetical protein